jgi:nucleoid-associated protein YgaU
VGKDYRTGLIAGLILAVVALIWVATWDSLSPSQRLARSGPAGADFGPSIPEASPPPEPNLPAEDSTTATVPETGPMEPDANAAPTRSPVMAPLVAEPPPPNVPDLTIYEQPEPIETTRFHIVQKNETLSAISKEYYGTAHQWQKILEANRDTITDANKISPGTKLIIPD